MSAVQNVEDRLKRAFISGEPGTTGREPFEDSTASGPGANFASGQSHAVPHSTGHDSHSSSAIHSGGTGLTGPHAHSSTTHANTNANTHTGLTGSNDTGSAAGLHGSSHTHQSNSQAGSAGAAAGVVGISGAGLDGLRRPAEDKTTGYTGPSHNRDHVDQRDNRGVVDKVKDALPGGNSSSTTSHNTSSHSTSHTSSSHPHYTSTAGTTGTDPNKRDIVDKVNDALPGTPAKTEQHYGHSNNPNTFADRSAGVAGAGTAYGAGAHGTSAPAHGRDHVGANTGTSTSTSGDNRGVVEKVKDALPGNNNTSSSSHTSSTTGTTGVASSHHGTVGSAEHPPADRSHHDAVHQDTSQRAPGQSSGGVSGLLATSDKDFTGRERQGKGAYADTDGLYKLNSTGPAGNSALTGREGTIENNPVAQAKSREGGSASTAHADVDEHGERKGLMAKIKGALS